MKNKTNYAKIGGLLALLMFSFALAGCADIPKLPGSEQVAAYLPTNSNAPSFQNCESDITCLKYAISQNCAPAKLVYSCKEGKRFEMSALSGNNQTCILSQVVKNFDGLRLSETSWAFPMPAQACNNMTGFIGLGGCLEQPFNLSCGAG